METISRSKGNRNKRSQEGKNSRGKPTHLQQVGASPSSSSSAVHRSPFPRSLVGLEGSSPAVAATFVKGETSDAMTGCRPSLPPHPPPPPPPPSQNCCKMVGKNRGVCFWEAGHTKRRRFVSCKDKTTLFSFFIFLIRAKTTLFWTKLPQNDVVLKQESLTQNDAVLSYLMQQFCPKQRRFSTCGISKKLFQSQNDVVLAQKMIKRRRFEPNQIFPK